MNHRSFKVLLVVLLLAAAVLGSMGSVLLIRQKKAQDAVTQRILEQNEQVLSRLEELIPTETSGQVLTPDELGEDASNTLSVLEIDGFSCVGILSIENRNLRWAVVNPDSDTEDCFLPVAASGYPAYGNFIIRGFRHKAQFSRLTEVSAGDTLTFQDVNGVTYTYTIADTSRLAMEQVNRTLSGQSTGLIVSGEAMQKTDEIDIQLFFDTGTKYRFIVDGYAVSSDR